MSQRIVNVQDFGAKGDLIHDDSAAFARAYRYASRKRRHRLRSWFWLLFHNPAALRKHRGLMVPAGDYRIVGR